MKIILLLKKLVRLKMNKSNISILITGGSGFIGKNLKEYFSEKYFVLAPTHSELDLTDKNSVDKYFKENKVDIIIHTANLGGKRNEVLVGEILKENLKIFLNIFEKRNQVKKILFIGSGAEYDKNRNLVNVKESEFGNVIPSDDYGFHKYICSRYIETSKNIINLRVFGIFGKYEDYGTRFISNIICRELYNLPIEINQNRIMDYIYIKDFCRIVEYFIENAAKEVFYNIGGEKCNLLWLVNKIKEISKREFEVLLKKPGFDREYTCNNSRLLKELKNFKFTPLEKAIEELYDWYTANRVTIIKDKILNS